MELPLLPFLQAHFVDGEKLFFVDDVPNILADAKVDSHFEEEVLLAVYVAHLVRELYLAEVPLLAKGLRLPLYVRLIVLFS